MSEFRRSLMSISPNSGKKYIVRGGVLVDPTITLDTIRYYSQWSSSDNREISYHDGYILYTGSCYNRHHGIIFRPCIVSKLYHTVFIDAEFFYNSSTDNANTAPIMGVSYGQTDLDGIETEMECSTEGLKYRYLNMSNYNIYRFDISDLDSFCLFLGAIRITNPDYGTVVKIYNIWLEGENTSSGHSEINYILWNEPTSKTSGFILDTGVYCTTLDYKLEYAVYGITKWGFVHNNLRSGTWICQHNVRFRWSNYNSGYYDIGSTDNSLEEYYCIYDMQSGVYKNKTLMRSFTVSLGADNISNIPIYYGGVYDFNDGNVYCDVPARTYPIRLYPLKIYKQDVLIRDFIPVIKDGEYCMYDKLNNKYHYNVLNNQSLLSHG